MLTEAQSMSIKKVVWKIALLFLSVLTVTTTLFSAPNGTIKGKTKDAQTKESLPFSNVFLLKTSLGSSADKEGNYIIRNVPPGRYTLRASYIGYEQKEVTVDIKEGVTIEQEFFLNPIGIEGEGIVVTAQAEGQMKAINEQLSSIAVKNVVSAARIQELPDANAAESVTRLPGVSLIRTGGEGSQVVIRGLSPQYNQITIDGVALSGNVASSNNLVSTDKNKQEGATNVFSGSAGDLTKLGDRAADLSMISSSMLGGIEVIKAITPDMDATLIGGVVNFGMRKAAKGIATEDESASWLPLVDIGAAGGYNQLKETYGDYRFVGSVEKRLLDESFGVFIQASTEKRNLSANELGATYDLKDKTHGDEGIPDLLALDLTDVFRKRERFGATVVLDYQHQGGEIGLMNFLSKSDTRTTRRGQSVVQEASDLWYTANDSQNELNVLSNLLSIKQDMPIFHVDLKLSHSYSESNSPDDLFFNFWQDAAGLEGRGDLSKVHPSTLAAYAVPNAANASLDVIETSQTFSRERSLTSSLDLQTDITVTDFITTKIKFGGMYQYGKRTYDYNQFHGSHLYSGGGGVITAITEAYPDFVLNGGRISFVNFINDSYSYGNFLNGDYSLAYPINVDLMWKLIPIIRSTNTSEGYRPNALASQFNDYSGNEEKSAGYAMVTFNLGEEIAIIPGVRYQNLTRTYTAMRGEAGPGGIQNDRDTTVTQSNGYFLPMAHLRYKPFDWLQIQFAYTNTLNYPDHGTVTPRYYIGQGFISYNNYRLKPATAENFDLVVSFYSNELGLLTVNGFKKRIKDLIFFSKTYLTDLSAYPDLPQDRKQLFEFNTYVNNPIPIDVEGIEAEWQTRFWYLPDPLTGIVFNINYTHIFSKASYPKNELLNEYDEEGNLKQTLVNTSYTTRLLNQPNDILNLGIGYDYEGFSARLSMLYQDNIFKKPDFWMQNRVNSDKYLRWDLSVKQLLPWFGIQVYFSLNNITGRDDIDLNQKTSFPASQQRYGMAGDLGLRVKL